MKNRNSTPFKIMHEQVGLHGGSPFKVKYCDYKHFTYPLHQHGELELMYIIESTGQYHVGNKVENFAPGDLMLIGSFLPHMHKNAAEYYEDNDLRVKAVILQFSFDFVSSELFTYPEMNRINDMIKLSANGIYFSVPKGGAIVTKMLSLLELKGTERFLAFLEFLHLLSRCKNFRTFNTTLNENYTSLHTDDRMVTVLGYLNRNYTEKISVAEVAKLACMNKTAFCRFFKEKTGKTLVNYVNELRVAYACKLLLDGTISVAQASFQAGFNNLSGFNRVFRSLIQSTPTEYKRQYRHHSGKKYDIENLEVLEV